VFDRLKENNYNLTTMPAEVTL